MSLPVLMQYKNKKTLVYQNAMNTGHWLPKPETNKMVIFQGVVLHWAPQIMDLMIGMNILQTFILPKMRAEKSGDAFAMHIHLGLIS